MTRLTAPWVCRLRASLVYWVPLAAKGGLGGAGGSRITDQVSPEQGELSRPAVGRDGATTLKQDTVTRHLLVHLRVIHAEVKGEYGWLRMHSELVARSIQVGTEQGFAGSCSSMSIHV